MGSGIGPSTGAGAGALQPTVAPAFARTFESDAPPMNAVGPNGPIALFKSVHT